MAWPDTAGEARHGKAGHGTAGTTTTNYPQEREPTMKARDRAAKIIAREERLRKLYQKNGNVLTPQAVVEDAKNPDSPLHDYFEWDDQKAAQAFRLDQARRLIREVRVEVEYSSQSVAVPTYVQDTRRDSGGYISVSDLRNDSDHAREVLSRRLGSLATEMKSNHHLADELGASDQFQDFLESLDSLRAAVEAVA